ncbi:Arc family DNA-binding protein [Pseudomonas helleri]|uniref:Arc family DNA-binding protein n=1 Tax=Pseudomonas helleri TaxID=1608996 RepID=UPI003FCF27F9
MSTPPWSIICDMSREDSQFKLRMPSELREAIENAAKEARRSLNAEIVARLEMSVVSPFQQSGEVLPAAKVRELAALSRDKIASTLKAKILDEIVYSASSGITCATVDLREFGLVGLTIEELLDVIGEVYEELNVAGYTVEFDAESLKVFF